MRTRNRPLSLANTIGQTNPIRYRGYYYDSETSFYYLQSRYYDAEIGRFLNADGQLNTNALFGYNMFAYCYNNPIVMADFDGRDAIYVVDYRKGPGLQIVGHSRLYLEDALGNWYVTEYTGGSKPEAIVFTDNCNENSEFISICNNEKIKGVDYTYLYGDFSESLNLANELNESNLGGYLFIGNNCLDYTQRILSKGKFDSKIDAYYAKTANPLSPKGYQSYLQVSNTFKKVTNYCSKAIKGVAKYAKKAWKKIKSIF